jgi:hypothetical protein
MGKFALIQAVYAVTGVLFFVRDLMVTKVPMGQAMINAFIWPYAQFQLMQTYVMSWIDAAAGLMR